MKALKFVWISVLLGAVGFSVSGCLLLAAGAGTEAGYILSQDERTAKETVDDQGLVLAVKSKLLADSEVSGLDINVDSFKAVITLKGVVETPEEAAKAIEIAQGVSGVKEVVSKLFVG